MLKRLGAENFQPSPKPETIEESVMVKVVQAITAKVGAIGKVKIGNYGKHCFVLFLDQSQPEGSESAKIWKSALLHLVPAGQDRNSKEKHNILRIDADSSTQQAMHCSDGTGTTWNDEQKFT